MQKTTAFFACFTLLAALTIAGCNNFLTPYKADVNQGNAVTADMVNKLKIGMTPAQVRYVLGTPLITDTLSPTRWDYLHTYEPGTYARKAGLKTVTNRRFTVFFENGVLAKMEGAENIPANAADSNPSSPESRDKALTEKPL